MIYVCSVCGYEYNEAEGDQEHGIASEQNLQIFPLISNVLYAV